MNTRKTSLFHRPYRTVGEKFIKIRGIKKYFEQYLDNSKKSLDNP